MKMFVKVLIFIAQTETSRLSRLILAVVLRLQSCGVPVESGRAALASHTDANCSVLYE